MHEQVFDYLHPATLDRVRNIETFAGILALNRWTCNARWASGGVFDLA